MQSSPDTYPISSRQRRIIRPKRVKSEELVAGLFQTGGNRRTFQQPLANEGMSLKLSSTGYGENSFFDLCQSEVPDHIEVEMRQVRQLV